ncbi:hypothetical protein N9E57_03340 [Gammaproteobacteria bacterium]|nr:hypothetical protein [Gammaproteobacteria bacterium]
MKSKEKAPLAGRALKLNTQPNSVMLINNLDNKTPSISDDYVELYNELNQLIKKYITMNDDDRNLLALDIMSNNLDIDFPYQPVIAFVSDDAGCGKTQALKLIHALHPDSILANRVSPAALRRVLENNDVVCLDEVPKDIWFKYENVEFDRAIKASFEKGSNHMLCEKDSGGNYSEKSFSVNCRLYFANVVDTDRYDPNEEIMSRIIQFVMRQDDSMFTTGVDMSSDTASIKSRLKKLKTAKIEQKIEELNIELQKNTTVLNGRNRDKYYLILLAAVLVNRFEMTLVTLLENINDSYQPNQNKKIEILELIKNYMEKEGLDKITGKQVSVLFNRKGNHKEKFSSSTKASHTLKLMGLEQERSSTSRYFTLNNVCYLLEKLHVYSEKVS